MRDGCTTQGPMLNNMTNAAFKLGQAYETYAMEVNDLRDKPEDRAR